MRKKVIEQPLYNITIIYKNNNSLCIEWLNESIPVISENRTTVAKAICPEYQKVEDERDALLVALQNQNERVKGLEQKNAKLVEALEGLLEGVEVFCKTIPAKMTSEAIHLWTKRRDGIEALQNTKNIEG